MTTETKNRGQRCRWRLPAIVLSLVLAAGSASAQTTNEKREHADSTMNPCNGEPVPYEGFVHIMEKTTTSGSGIHFNATYRFHGQGIGGATQLKYSVGGTAKMNGKFPPGPVTTRQRTRVVSQGPVDNFHATFIFHANGNGEPTKMKIESDCNGSSNGGR